MSSTGYAVLDNGVPMIRTATNTRANAMRNGLVLVFGYQAQVVDWAEEDPVRTAWRLNAGPHGERYTIAAVEVVARQAGEDRGDG